MSSVSAKNRKNIKRAVLFLLLAGMAFFAVWQSDYFQRKFFYQLLYDKDIKNHAAANNLNPWLVAAVIKNESGFKASAVSERGAVGLMQIMPETGSWIALKAGLRKFAPGLLAEPSVNIRLGCWYLQDLNFEFQSEPLAITAYNAGRGQVKAWLGDKQWDGRDVEKIPFAETRQYVKKVLSDKEMYKRLYKDVWEQDT
ncbi:MAG: lytic transglycosylase domain-containing protein [Acidaminococcales bacterium]|jgi:soluble lytic murein transglycosylase|nr:lytic transglycosylase domain-containing protein [Acidaminococcales bacterium]